MSKKRPFMPFFGDDFIGSTAGWPFGAREAYMMLLWYQWQNDRIPIDDDAMLRRIAGCEARQWNHIRDLVRSKFDSTGRNSRAAQEISKMQEISQKRTEAVNKRWSNSNTNVIPLTLTPILTLKEEKDISPKKKKSPNGYSTDFLAFWEKYPRKTGKGAAWKSYAKAVEDGAEPLSLITALEERRGGLDNAADYLPHPATWLNQRRWEDESPSERSNAEEEAMKRRLGL